MITLTKGSNTKVIDDSSSIMPILLAQGWVKEQLVAEEVIEPAKTKKKDLKDGISSTSSN